MPSAAALEAHHLLDHGLRLLGDLGLLAGAIGAVLAKLESAAAHLDADQLVDLVVTSSALGHAPIL
jgi:hypothetical protein